MKSYNKAKWFTLGMIAALVISTTVIPAIAATLDVALNSINIKVNGVQVADVGDTMTLSNGNEVPFSIVYQGTTYLPLGKLAELFGKDAVWDGEANTAVISDKKAAAPARKTENYHGVSFTYDGAYSLTKDTSNDLLTLLLEQRNAFILVQCVEGFDSATAPVETYIDATFDSLVTEFNMTGAQRKNLKVAGKDGKQLTGRFVIDGLEFSIDTRMFVNGNIGYMFAYYRSVEAKTPDTYNAEYAKVLESIIVK